MKHLTEFNVTIQSTHACKHTHTHAHKQRNQQTDEVCYRAWLSEVRMRSHLGRRCSNWDCLSGGRSVNDCWLSTDCHTCRHTSTLTHTCTADVVTTSEDDAELTNNENSGTVTILHSTHSQVKYNYSGATRGHMSPTLAAPVLIMTSFSLWHLVPTALASPILIKTSLATELATPRVMDVGYVRTDTLPHLISASTVRMTSQWQCNTSTYNVHIVNL